MFAVHPWHCPELTIEFVPSGPDFEKLEDPTVGNSNPFVELVAGILNSFASAALDEKQAGEGVKLRPTNRAFHSDEGGRPYVRDTELPIATFFPNRIRTFMPQPEDEPPRPKTAPQPPVMITNLVMLARVVSAILDQGDVSLHHGWLYDMMTQRDKDDPNRTGPIWLLLRKIFPDPQSEALNAEWYDTLAAGLKKLVGDTLPSPGAMYYLVQALAAKSYPELADFASPQPVP
jgi:hypothetical protein